MNNLRDPFAGGSPPVPSRPRAAGTPLIGRLGHKHLALGFYAGMFALVLLSALVIGSALLPFSPLDHRVDAHFISIGQTYRTELGKVYARAWEDGARNLESGAGAAAAIDGVAKSWDAGRVSLFESLVTPELVKIVPEGKADKDITAEDRSRLAAAWRGFAKGLGGHR